MGGLGLTLNTAKDALLSQRLAIDVVSHNIANVNTPGYTRQTPVLEANDPALYAGMVMGRGVSVDQILRNSNTLIETSLQQRKSDLSATEEEEVYMKVLESLFNESSDGSLSAQLSEFWNAWHDLANNPSGLPERTILYEKGALLSQAFGDLSGNLSQLDQELNLSIGGGVGKINELLAGIADLNPQIVSLQSMGNANDLLDKRNNLVTELSEYLDVRTFEQEDGNLTVTTGSGYTLVSHSEVYSLEFDAGRIKWESSGTTHADITDTITGGKMGGWLEVRDVIAPQYKSELDELAKSIVWEVNGIHTQGAGLKKYEDTLTASYGVGEGNAATDLANTALDFRDGIGTGSFNIWVYDNAGNVVGGGPKTVSIFAGPGGTSLEDLIASIDGPDLAAGEVDGKLVLTPSAGYSFAFSDDTSHVLTALGINTFFTGSDARSMGMNAALNADKSLIAAGRMDSAGEMAVGDNSNALAMTKLQYRPVSMSRYEYERGEADPVEIEVDDTIENYLYSLVASIGTRSQSTSRAREYNEVIVNKLTDTRNNLSAVSLDEEMTNLIKYQQAYMAAAKLISTVDEMYQALLDTKQT
jgi:flagellar hook-associated protein 1 FlgK